MTFMAIMLGIFLFELASFSEYLTAWSGFYRKASSLERLIYGPHNFNQSHIKCNQICPLSSRETGVRKAQNKHSQPLQILELK